MKEKELEGILESIFDGLYLVDLQRKIRYWNRAAERITGFARDEVMGTSCADDVLVHVTADGCSLCRSGCPLSAVMDDGEPREAEVFLHHKQGHRLPVSVRVSPLRDLEGNITGGIELFTDISHREALALQIAELKRHALVDAVKGLPNRRHLESVLKNSLDQMERVSVPFGILFADIDYFKKFNDDHGHETGDLALKTVAETLLTSVRAFDAIGRWGGEEFLGIFPNTTPASLAEIGERVRALVQASRVHAGPSALAVTLSIGGTVAVPGDSTQSILKRADLLLYRSKQEGRNRVIVDGAEQAPVHERK
ncbi:MAG TPA: sensor domain-containing diguanylate cyclase [Syntrophales bacterium]|nr:sensor domain-containing diguanylate cyclase [Syntrophales bacterium]